MPRVRPCALQITSGPDPAALPPCAHPFKQLCWQLACHAFLHRQSGASGMAVWHAGKALAGMLPLQHCLRVCGK